MAKRTSWNRDSIGRFAGGGNGTSKAAASVRAAGARRTAVGRRLSAVKATRIQRGITSRRAAERSYVRQTGDVGTARDQARVKAKDARMVAKRNAALRKAGRTARL